MFIRCLDISFLMNGVVHRYRRNFLHPYVTLLKVFLKSYPFNVKTREGRDYKIRNGNEIFLLSLNGINNVKIYLDGDTILLNFLGKTLKFDGATDDGDINGVFFLEQYAQIDPRGRVVIDIGANIGDSSIYFAARLAEKVFALEPFPQTYALAKHNVRINNLDKVVTLLNLAIADKAGIVFVDKDAKDTAGKTPSKSMSSFEPKNVVGVTTITFEELFDNYKLSDVILKMDCEGCEFEVIPNLKSEISAKISSVIMEYHADPEPIIKRLQTLGFRISTKRSGNGGILFAKRN
jgi:FkbM family methyltransferase